MPWNAEAVWRSKPWACVRSKHRLFTSSHYFFNSAWPLLSSVSCTGGVGGRPHVNNAIISNALSMWLWHFIVLCVQRNPGEEMRDCYCESRGAEQLQGQYGCIPPEKLCLCPHCLTSFSQCVCTSLCYIFISVLSQLSFLWSGDLLWEIQGIKAVGYQDVQRVLEAQPLTSVKIFVKCLFLADQQIRLHRYY